MKTALAAVVVTLGCSHPIEPASEPPASGVVFTYPVDNQLDVPLGARVIVSFAQPIADELVVITAPDGRAIATDSHVVGSGHTFAITSSAFEPGTTYSVSVGSAETGGALFRFTTRSDRPRAGVATLVAIDGSDPASPGSFRPIVETSSLQLVFSEPLDPRTIDGIHLVDASSAEVPCTRHARGIHVTLDPISPLVAGASYQLRVGDPLRDLGGDLVAAMTVSFTPANSLGSGAIAQTFRTRSTGDPVAAIARTDTTNQMDLVHPLIGHVTDALQPGVLATQLGDPKALDGPIAFTIPKGQQLAMSNLDIQLAGAVPSGLATGDLRIELIADAGGRIYRNRYRGADTPPDNDGSPLLVDLALDIAIYATDPTGNAALAETILGIQLTGLAMIDDGVLAIETLGAMDVDLLGLGTAAANLSLDLVSDPTAVVAVDQQPPSLLASLPAVDTDELAPDHGIEVVFDEPIDIDRARAGGIVLRDSTGTEIATTLELDGSVVIVRPRAPLPDGTSVAVVLDDVADLAGNAMTPTSLQMATPALAATTVPMTVVSVYPGTACAVAGTTTTSAGRCTGGATTDEGYAPFTLAANERVDVVFDQRVAPASVVLGSTCDAGSVRVEHVDATGACTEPVAGTLELRGRELAFVPDRAWQVGEHYRLRLVSGPDATCNPGELCSAAGAASFDPLAGTTAGGGPDLAIDFVATPATTATSLSAGVAPATDVNGSGIVETGEVRRDANRVALQIAGTSGLITGATFTDPDCVAAMPGVQACMYMTGSMPAHLGDRRDSCALPDGTTAPTCVPVTLSAQTMFATSVTMTASALGIGLTTATGTSVMRVREPTGGPLEGYIVDRDGTPTMIVALELYMDAPNMTLPLSQHDLHSKPLSVMLVGPVTFRADGRIAIELSNPTELPISVGIDAPLGITGTVDLVVPAGEMKLQLMSPAHRGALP